MAGHAAPLLADVPPLMAEGLSGKERERRGKPMRDCVRQASKAAADAELLHISKCAGPEVGSSFTVQGSAGLENFRKAGFPRS